MQLLYKPKEEEEEEEEDLFVFNDTIQLLYIPVLEFYGTRS